jgi:hypothetical protein
MRTLLMTSTMLLALAAMPALADVSPITGQPEPMSNAASNLTPSDTRSEVAPALPAPAAEGPRDLLMTASQDLSAHRTGAAQEALERAETRILDRSVPATVASQPDNGAPVNLIRQALTALGNNDVQSANSYTQQALQALPPEAHGAAMIGQPAAPYGAQASTTNAP